MQHTIDEKFTEIMDSDAADYSTVRVLQREIAKHLYHTPRENYSRITYLRKIHQSVAKRRKELAPKYTSRLPRVDAGIYCDLPTSGARRKGRSSYKSKLPIISDPK